MSFDSCYTEISINIGGFIVIGHDGRESHGASLLESLVGK